MCVHIHICNINDPLPCGDISGGGGVFELSEIYGDVLNTMRI